MGTQAQKVGGRGKEAAIPLCHWCGLGVFELGQDGLPYPYCVSCREHHDGTAHFPEKGCCERGA